MKKISPYYIVLASLLLWSCGAKQEDKFEVLGKIEGLPKDVVVYLDELGFDNQQKIVDSTRANDKGNFTLSGQRDKELKLYRVRIGNTGKAKDIFVLNDQPEVQLSGTWSNIDEEYTIKGSAGSKSLQDLKQQYERYVRQVTELHLSLDNLRMQATPDDSVLFVAQSELKQLNNKNLDFFLRYTDTTKFLPVAILATIFAADIDNNALLSDAGRMAPIISSFEKRFSGQPLLAKFKDNVENNTKVSGKAQSKIKFNELAPDFSLKDVNGKDVQLSSFKGKYLLLDFWAGWCAPCRKENPNLVAAYKMYKGKNFEILGVSLDEDKTKWKEAIAADNLTWTQVSDLGGWRSDVVELYGIESIPSNFLLDPDGKIIDASLTGEHLHDKLAEVLK